jgi:hypothetical protein
MGSLAFLGRLAHNGFVGTHASHRVGKIAHQFFSENWRALLLLAQDY